MTGYSGERTLGALLTHQAAALGETPFVRSGEQCVSYAEANRRANRAAHALAGHGVGPGEVVCVLLDNSLEFLDVWFGLAKVGAVQAPLNTSSTAWQLRGLLAELGAATVVTQPRYVPALGAAAAPGLRRVVLVEPAGDGAAPGGAAPVGAPVTSWRSMTAAAPDTEPDVQVRPTDPVAVMQTSGTTSAAKGVLLCHEHEFHVAETIGAHLDMRADDRFYNFFPLFHNTAQGMITWSVLLHGASMLLTDRFSGSRFWADVTRHRCTLFFCMGPMVEFLLKGAGPPGATPLRMGWGIGYGQAMADEFRDRFGVELIGGYGCTEAGLVSLHPREDPRLDTAGRPHPDYEVRVADSEDRELPTDEVGEIVVRPRLPYTTTLGYLNRPAETAELTRNCWLHTGDAGRFDADGYLHFVDRIKDVIRRRGENISSFEVEAVCGEFPGVRECAAVAVPAAHGRHEDEIYLAVVMREGADLDPVALVRHGAERLAYFAVPRYVEVWNDLPKTPTGKVRKVDVRAHGVTDRTWDRVAAGIEFTRDR